MKLLALCLGWSCLAVFTFTLLHALLRCWRKP